MGFARSFPRRKSFPILSISLDTTGVKYASSQRSYSKAGTFLIPNTPHFTLVIYSVVPWRSLPRPQLQVSGITSLFSSYGLSIPNPPNCGSPQPPPQASDHRMRQPPLASSGGGGAPCTPGRFCPRRSRALLWGLQAAAAGARAGG